MVNPRVCLNMIVKNESHVIERCLESITGIIDHWVIVDTGSEDGTPECIRKFFRKHNIPGVLYEREWVDFGHNRTEALSLAEEYNRLGGEGEYNNVPVAHLENTRKFDFIFFIDADEILIVPENFRWPEILHGPYYCTVVYGTLEYVRNTIIPVGLGFYWEGVLHEYLTCKTPHVWQTLPLTITSPHDGARGRNPSTYLKDIAMLERAVAGEPMNTRNVFYLAQSYRDAGIHDKAVDMYQKRFTMGGWDEECWYSLFQIAVLYERMQKYEQIVHQAYLAAYSYRSTRAEPLVELARYFRERKQYALAVLYATAAADIPYPDDILFIDSTVYRYRALDELVISGYYAGGYAYNVAKRAVTTLMERMQNIPQEHKARILMNCHCFDGYE